MYIFCICSILLNLKENGTLRKKIYKARFQVKKNTMKSRYRKTSLKLEIRFFRYIIRKEMKNFKGCQHLKNELISKKITVKNEIKGKILNRCTKIILDSNKHK